MKKRLHTFIYCNKINCRSLLFWVTVLMGSLSPNLFSQTVLINPSGDGGFESGASLAANGWTEINGAVNPWYVGTSTKKSGTNGAYISNDLGVNNNYTLTTAAVSHFYRDVTFPVGESAITLTFDYKGVGESTFDFVQVFLIPTTVTPVAGTQLVASLTQVRLGNQYINLQTGYTTYSFVIPASAAGTTQRLVFSWKNDASGGSSPAGAVDNITLLSKAVTPLAGLYTVDNTSSTSSSNFQSLSEAVSALNAHGISSSVTFNIAAGQTFDNYVDTLKATGTSSSTITFQKSGVGANPVITNEGSGASGTAGDALFMLFGSDFVTINGLDFITRSTSTTVEFGLNMVNATSTNGARFNNVINCNVNLKNTASSSNTASIAFRIHAWTAPTDTNGNNSYNTVKNVSSQNAYRGILLSGGSSTNRDRYNTITADPSYISPISGAATGYNDIGNATVSQSSGLRGVELLGQDNVKVEKCEIRNLVNTSTSSTNDLAGIVINSTFTNLTTTISENILHDFTSSSTGTQVVYGLWTNGAAGVGPFNISRNRIFKITGASTGSGSTRGMLLASSASGVINCNNNLIYQLNNPACTGAPGIRGIELNSAVTVNLYYNTVYLDATSTLTTTSFQTACLYMASSTSTILDSRNNIFVNKSTTAPTGTATRAVAFYKTTATIGTQIATTSNNNLLFAGTASSKNLLAYDATTGYQTLTTYRAWLVSPRETNAKTEDVPFVSTSGTYDLNIQLGVPTFIANGGTPVSITIDFNNTTRNATNPDIGAYEGNFTPIYNNDIGSLAFVTPSAGGTQIEGQLFTPRATFKNYGLIDQSGFDVRMIIKGPLPAVSEVYNEVITVSSLTAGASLSVDFNSSGTDGLAAGAYTLQVISELSGDEFPTNDTLTTTFLVAGPLSGDYLVGTGQTAPFDKLSTAINRLNAVGVSSSVRFILTDASYSTSETFPLTINQFSGSSATNTVTIKPQTGTNVTITGSNSTAIFNLNGADYVTIDGSESPSSFLIRNSLNTAPVINFASDATYNTIKYCTVEGGNTTTTNGVVMFGAGTVGNSFNEIRNNKVRDRSDLTALPVNLIYSSSTLNSSGIIRNNQFYNFTGSGVNLSSAGDNWNVDSNYIFQVSSKTTALTCINIGTGNNHTVNRNSIGGAAIDRSGSPLSTTGIFVGIQLSVGAVTASKVNGNTLSNIFCDNSTGVARMIRVSAGNVEIGSSAGNIIGGNASSPDTIRLGYDSEMISYSGTGVCRIENNEIGNINYWDAGGDRAFGIIVSSGTGIVKNNVVRDIKSNSTGTASGVTSFFPAGIVFAPTATTGNILDSNRVYNIQHTNNTSGAYTIAGFVISIPTAATDAIVQRNRVHTITTVATGVGLNSSRVWGMLILAGTANYINNMVTVGETVSNDARISGITDTSASGTNGFYYNTVVISGSHSGSGTNNSYSFRRPVTVTPSTDNLRNNILVNTRTGGTGNYHFAIGVSSATGWTATSSNYNNLYSSNSASIGEWVSVLKDFTEWKNSSAGDNNSVTRATQFLSPTDLHLGGASVGDLNLIGTPIISISDKDIDNESRSATFPYMGADEASIPLPVELVNFSGKAKSRNVNLTWETKTETDNSGFEIERKDKNGDWKKIGFVEGFGSSNSPKYYTYEDKKLSSGKHNYRLKQIDNDGTTSYSDEVEVTIDVPTEFALSQNYPNPFNPSTKVDYQLAMDAKVTIELYSITGERVATLLSQELEAGYYSMMIDSYTHGMASGIYIYRMIATDALGKSFVSTKKLSLIK